MRRPWVRAGLLGQKKVENLNKRHNNLGVWHPAVFPIIKPNTFVTELTQFNR